MTNDITLLGLRCEVTMSILQSTKLVAEVYDKGMITSTLIGRGECSLLAIAYEGYFDVLGKDQPFTIDIVSKDKPAGRLVINASARIKKDKVNLKDIVVPKDFECGAFWIKSITAHNLANTEFWGKQVY